MRQLLSETLISVLGSSRCGQSSPCRQLFGPWHVESVREINLIALMEGGQCAKKKKTEKKEETPVELVTVESMISPIYDLDFQITGSQSEEKTFGVTTFSKLLTRKRGTELN